MRTLKEKREAILEAAKMLAPNVLGKERKENTSIIRQCLVYALIKFTGMTQAEAAKVVNRARVTACYSCSTVDSLLKIGDKKTKTTIEVLTKAMNGEYIDEFAIKKKRYFNDQEIETIIDSIWELIRTSADNNKNEDVYHGVEVIPGCMAEISVIFDADNEYGARIEYIDFLVHDEGENEPKQSNLMQYADKFCDEFGITKKDINIIND